MLPTCINISGTFKNGVALESEEKIMGLREAALELQGQTLSLKRQVRYAERQFKPDRQKL